MPGIVGIISSRPANVCEELVKTMVATMTHEPFYRTGTYFAPPLGVYAGWTALADSFAERQVFLNETGDVALVLAGECFLDPATKDALKQKGHLPGDDPGGWLVHLYEELGANFFERLNGLFSGLLIDRREHQAWLFNDRYGVQRIYYHADGADFYFASEAKALLRILPGLREFETDGVAEFLAFGCTLDDRSLFKGIKRLPGAARWRFDHGRCQRETYFSPETWAALPALSAAEYEARFQSTFRRILPRYFANAPAIGLALTGGLDTRMIMAGRPTGGAGQTGYTFSGPAGWTLDDRIAARVARAGGLSHQLLRLEPDFFANFGAHADKTVYVTEGGSGIFGAHEIYFNRQARSLAPVRLTGNYGSEVLRGVSMFKPLPLEPALFHADWAGRVRAALPGLGRDQRHPVISAAFREIPWLAFGNLMAGWSQVSFRTPYLDNEVVALACQAPAVSRHSSEPALRFIQSNDPGMSAIPTDRGFIGDHRGAGHLWRRLFAEVTFKLEYYNNEGLPRMVSPLNPVYEGVASRLGLAGRHKFLRYASWFRSPLRDYVNDRLASPTTRQSRFWNPEFVNTMAADHVSGRKNQGLEIHTVLTLEAVERVLFRDLPRS